MLICMYKIFTMIPFNKIIDKLYIIYFIKYHCKYKKYYVTNQKYEQLLDIVYGMGNQYKNIKKIHKRIKSIYNRQPSNDYKEILKNLTFLLKYYRIMNRIIYKKAMNCSTYGYYKLRNVYNEQQLYQLLNFGSTGYDLHTKFNNVIESLQQFSQLLKK